MAFPSITRPGGAAAATLLVAASSAVLLVHYLGSGSPSGGGGGSSFNAVLFVAVPVAQGGLGNDSDATNCARVASADTPPGGADHGCATLKKACSLASAGDTIKVYGGGGTYPTVSTSYPNQTILRTDCNPTSDVSFKSAAGETANLDGFLSLGNSQTTNGGAPNHLSFDGINMTNGTVVFFRGANTDPVPTGDTYKNAHISCMHGTTSGTPVGAVCDTHLTYILGGDSITIGPNVELGPMCCDGDLGNLFGSASNIPSNITYDGIYAHDNYDTCLNFPAALTSQGYTCDHLGFGDLPTSAATLQTTLSTSTTSFTVSGVTDFPASALPFGVNITGETMNVTAISGTTWTVTRAANNGGSGTGGCQHNVALTHAIGDAITLCDPGYDHVDGFQLEGSNGLTIQNSRIYALNIGRTVAQGIFGEAVGSDYTGTTTIQNNAISSFGTCGFCFDGSGSSHYGGTVNILYNTFANFRFDQGDLANGVTLNIFGNLFVSGMSNGNGGSGWGCTWTPGSGTATVNMDYNLLPAGKTLCGAHDITGTGTFVGSTGGNTPDLRLSGAQAAINGGETGGHCPATDAFGTARPINGVCDIGFHEAG